MRPLTAREWLEQERLSRLPHADFAAEVLADMDRLEGYDEDDTRDQATSDLEDIETHVKACEGESTVDRVEWAVDQLEQLTVLTGGEIGTVRADLEQADERFWDIWAVLQDAGLVDRDTQLADTDIPALLRMFLPC